MSKDLLAQQAQAREEGFKSVEAMWAADIETVKQNESFLASRSYAVLRTPVSAPYFQKLHRQNTPSKHYGDYVTKTGVKSQCVSFINGPLKTLPYYGAGDFFLINKSNIVADESSTRAEDQQRHEDVTNPAIFQRDAWTTRTSTRQSGALTPKNTGTISDFVGLRGKGYMQKYSKNSFSDLVDDLFELKESRFSLSVNPMALSNNHIPYIENNEKYTLEPLDMNESFPPRSALNKIYFKIENGKIQYQCWNKKEITKANDQHRQYIVDSIIND